VALIKKKVILTNKENLDSLFKVPWGAAPEREKACLAVWLRVLFKQLFVPKCMSMMFFYFLKLIFNISTSKRSKT
jgi:hypothetical protein